ncbi:MAG: helix-turn-helix domain-containing protein [Bacteroidota bacterium]
MSQKAFFPSEPFEQSLKSFHLEVLDQTSSLEKVANAYHLIWIREGKGCQKIDLTTLDVQQNTLSFVGPHQMYAWEGGIVQGYQMTFTLDFLCATGFSDQSLNELHLFGDPQPCIHLDQAQDQKLLQMVRWWEEEVEAPSEIAEAWVGTMLKLILLFGHQIHRVRTKRKEEQRIISDLTHRFKELVEEKYTSWHKVKEYADALFITPNHLNDQVKHDLGQSAKVCIQERIILEAKRMAHFTDQSLKETSAVLGFQDSSHFGKFFKQHAGMSFSSFRKSIK